MRLVVNISEAVALFFRRISLPFMRRPRSWSGPTSFISLSNSSFKAVFAVYCFNHSHCLDDDEDGDEDEMKTDVCIFVYPFRWSSEKFSFESISADDPYRAVSAALRITYDDDWIDHHHQNQRYNLEMNGTHAFFPWTRLSDYLINE